MPRAPGVRALLLVGALGHGCIAPEPDRGASPLVPAFVSAARETGVPADLLLAVAYVETRFSSRRGRPSRLGGYGMLHLRQGATLELAARASGLSRARLREGNAENIRGAAHALRALALAARGALPADLAGWRDALATYSGLGDGAFAYADEILELLRRGADGADDEGLTLRVPAHPELTAAARAPHRGRQTFALRPDHPAATWDGPACNSEPRTQKVTHVVIHTCQGGFSACVSWLERCDNGPVSAHYVVASSGKISQLVEEQTTAWHATCINKVSVGIEHEGYVEDPQKWFTEAMYCESAKLVRAICDRHGLACDRDHVIGHNEVTTKYTCSSAHADPGQGWDWPRFMGYVQNGCGDTTYDGGAPAPVDAGPADLVATAADRDAPADGHGFADQRSVRADLAPREPPLRLAEQPRLYGGCAIQRPREPPAAPLLLACIALACRRRRAVRARRRRPR